MGLAVLTNGLSGVLENKPNSIEICFKTAAIKRSSIKKYDSVHGILPQNVSSDDSRLIVDGQSINYVQQADPC